MLEQAVINALFQGKYQEPKRGDHVVARRGGYTHHGLYVGDDLVVHFAGFSEPFRKGGIELTTLGEFICPQPDSSIRGWADEEARKILRVATLSMPVFDANERSIRAMSRVGEEGYSLLWNNCEHFVHWCAYDFKHSNQVSGAVKSIAGAAVATRFLGAMGPLGVVGAAIHVAPTAFRYSRILFNRAKKRFER